MAENTEILRQRLYKTEMYMGDFDPNKAGGYDVLNQVSLFGCVWESKIDDNVSAPAVWDGGDTITPNTQDWKQVSGDYQAWLLNKDRPAQSEEYPFNNMGYVVLQKNIVNTAGEGETPVYKNLLTQDAFYKDGPNNTRVPNTNTIFEVRYAFELSEDVTIPSGSELKFNGGSISGAYTITGNNTVIFCDNNTNVFNGVTINGSYYMENITHKMFAGYNNDTELLRAMLNMLFNNSAKATLSLENNRTYNIYHEVFSSYLMSIYMYSNVSDKTIIGNNATINDQRTRAEIWGQGRGGDGNFDGVLQLDKAKNININGLNYQNLNEDNGFTYDDNLGYVGYSFILLLGDCDNININVNVNGPRYGVKTGDYSRPSATGLKGLTNSKIIVNAQKTGYPIVIALGDNLFLKTNSKTHHRAIWAGGITNTKIEAIVEDPHIAPLEVLVCCSHHSDNVNTLYYKEFSDLDITVEDFTNANPAVQTQAVGFQVSAESVFDGRTEPFNIQNVKVNAISHYGYVAPANFDIAQNGKEFSDVFNNFAFIVKSVIHENSAPFRIWYLNNQIYSNFVVSAYNTLVAFRSYTKTDGHYNIIFKQSESSTIKIQGPGVVVKDSVNMTLGDFLSSINNYILVKNTSISDIIGSTEIYYIDGIDGWGDSFPTLHSNIKFYSFFNTSLKRVGIWDGTKWLDDKANSIGAIVGMNPPSDFAQHTQWGYQFWSQTTRRLAIWNGYETRWEEVDGAKYNVLRSGRFAQKPDASEIYIGFRYFCNDRQTTEGATNGIEIIYKGQDLTDPQNPVDIWVDALGRTVS